MASRYAFKGVVKFPNGVVIDVDNVPIMLTKFKNHI